MARTPSTMPPLGASMPAFRLTDQVSGQTVDSQSLFGNPILVMYITRIGLPNSDWLSTV